MLRCALAQAAPAAPAAAAAAPLLLAGLAGGLLARGVSMGAAGEVNHPGPRGWGRAGGVPPLISPPLGHRQPVTSESLKREAGKRSLPPHTRLAANSSSVLAQLNQITS